MGLLAALVLALLPGSAQAAFPGENGKIAFTTTAGQIATINPDGTGLTTLTMGSNPAYSSDGTKIAFSSGRDGNSEIYVMNADGSDQRRLTTYPGADHSPSWAPGGERIAFVRNDDIWSMRADGSDPVNLTNTPDWEGVPAWSPDGSTIAYLGVYQIEGVTPDGTKLGYLGDGQDPAWSPVGRELWESYEWSDDVEEEIYSYITTLNYGGGGSGLFFFPYGHARQPAPSPDNTAFAYTGQFSPSLGIMTRAQVNRPLPVNGSDPDWQPIVNRPPDCSGVSASPVLTTANRRLVPVTLDGATDPDGDAVTLSVDGVTQDEPVESSGDATSPDAIDDGEGELRVRAERNPRGDGRVYRIAFTAADGRGGECSGTATVSVPRKKRKAAVDSAPPSYDSLAR